MYRYNHSEAQNCFDPLKCGFPKKSFRITLIYIVLSAFSHISKFQMNQYGNLDPVNFFLNPFLLHNDLKYYLAKSLCQISSPYVLLILRDVL